MTSALEEMRRAAPKAAAAGWGQARLQCQVYICQREAVAPAAGSSAGAADCPAARRQAVFSVPTRGPYHESRAGPGRPAGRPPSWAAGGTRALSCHAHDGDRLLLRGLLFHGFHGVLEEERVLGQKFLVDVDAWTDLRRAGETDDLESTVSYADIYRDVKEIMEGPPYRLLESVGQAVCDKLLARHLAVTRVRVRVGKPHVAVEGPVDLLGVEMTRNRQ